MVQYEKETEILKPWEVGPGSQVKEYVRSIGTFCFNLQDGNLFLLEKRQQANSTYNITRCHISIFITARYSYLAKKVSCFFFNPYLIKVVMLRVFLYALAEDRGAVCFNSPSRVNYPDSTQRRRIFQRHSLGKER